MAEEARTRCYLIYAIAPEGTGARAANEALNEYIADLGRGVPIFHDHFAGSPHGGVAVVFPRSEEELARLEDPGPLEGWALRVHGLTFALAPTGFLAQTDFTLEAYGKTSAEQLAASEPDDPRYWWRRGD